MTQYMSLQLCLEAHKNKGELFVSSYRLVFKQFFKNKFLSIFTLTFFSVLFIKIFYSITVCVQTNSEPLDYLRQTLSIAIYSFIYFLFISNDFFYNTHKENILEILRSTKKGMVVYYFSAFSSLFTIAFIYNVIVSVINIIIYYFKHKKRLRGYVLLSQAVSHQVPSALKSLTSVFGMGTGVSSLL